MERRVFIKKSTAAGLALSLNPIVSCTTGARPLKVLVLGGTYFVGPAIIQALLAQNHHITIFNRGVTNPTLFPDLEWIKGDRDKGLEAYAPLQERKWDVVIDVWPEKSILVDQATQALQDHAEHYIFISSIAVYNNFQEVGLNEDSGVIALPESKEEWYYGEEKVAAEVMVKERFSNHTILRPGAIKGWRDPAVDLLYWCIKLRRDEQILAPGSGNDPIQFIDVRDVGRVAAMSVEEGLQGTYNCLGPQDPLLWKDFLETAKLKLDSNTELVWADEPFLKANNVASFSDLPLWAPLSEDKGFMQISNRKLSHSGFEFTDMGATLKDCLQWFDEHMDKDLKFGTDETGGLSRSRELELLAKLTR